MALFNCPECNNQISDTAEKCPHCGYPLAKVKKSNVVTMEFVSDAFFAPHKYTCTVKNVETGEILAESRSGYTVTFIVDKPTKVDVIFVGRIVALNCEITVDPKEYRKYRAKVESRVLLGNRVCIYSYKRE